MIVFAGIQTKKPGPRGWNTRAGFARSAGRVWGRGRRWLVHVVSLQFEPLSNRQRGVFRGSGWGLLASPIRAPWAQVNTNGHQVAPVAVRGFWVPLAGSGGSGEIVGVGDGP